MFTVDGFPVDVAVREEHTFSSRVTSNPVEDGSDFTDHILNDPEFVRVEGIVSDTPLSKMAGLRTSGIKPSEDALVTFLVIRENKEPVTIETSLQIYQNMVLENLTIPRSAQQGGALFFSATFKKAVLVTNNKTTTKVAVPRAKKKASKGHKPSVDAASKNPPPTQAPRRRSVLHKLFKD